MLNDFLDRWEPSRASVLITNTKELIGAFRQKRLPIIWVRQEFKPDLSDSFLEMRDQGISITIEGTRGAKIHEALDWKPEETTLVKKRYSAFFGTNLDSILEALDADLLILCGINTHACIRCAAIDAYQRDLRVVLAIECIDSYDEEHSRISISYMNGKIARTLTNAEILQLVRKF